MTASEPTPRSGTPETVAIIMDGNGRWASARDEPVSAGHRAGARALRRTVESAIDVGIRTLCVYAFSTENWARPADEVSDLQVILAETIDRELPDLAKQGVRTRFMGRRDRLPQDVVERMGRLELTTAPLDVLDLWIAFDYGGRSELVDAARALVAGGVPAAAVDETSFGAHLAAPELPDVDLLIRTSGELRLSNFLLWHASYAELVFTDTLWPDFGDADLRSAVEEFARRGRRFGGR